MVVIAVIIGLVLVWYFLLKNPEGVKALGSTAQGFRKTESNPSATNITKNNIL